MLKRKIEQKLAEWKSEPNHKPLILKGCRQCGKTSSVISFAEKNYKHVVYLNFFADPDYGEIFSGSLAIDDLTVLITALLGPGTVFEAGETVLILDEIQECPNARTSLKFWHLDGRYDVIGTGSLLGVKGYGDAPRSIPVGFETVMDMYPMDLEEFLWANGINEDAIDMLRRYLSEESPVPTALHVRMRELLLRYTVVGGMPEAVQLFVDTNDINKVLSLQRNIVRGYEDDMVKYAEKKIKQKSKNALSPYQNSSARKIKNSSTPLLKREQALLNSRAAFNGYRTRG